MFGLGPCDCPYASVLMFSRLLLPSSPAEKTAEQIEEERRRKAREDRFKSSTEAVTDGEEQNGAEKRKLDDLVQANTTEEPVCLARAAVPPRTPV